MYQTLMNLYTGNLDFQKKNIKDLPLQKYHDKEYDKIKDKLDNMLSEDGKRMLNELIDTHIDCRSYSDYEAFINGFRFATMLMVEVYHESDNQLEIKEKYLRHFLHRPFAGTPSPLED